MRNLCQRAARKRLSLAHIVASSAVLKFRCSVLNFSSTVERSDLHTTSLGVLPLHPPLKMIGAKYLMGVMKRVSISHSRDRWASRGKRGLRCRDLFSTLLSPIFRSNRITSIMEWKFGPRSAQLVYAPLPSPPSVHEGKRGDRDLI